MTRMRLPHPNRLFLQNLSVFIAASALFLALGAPFAGQWDSFDYLKQIVTHRLSDLGFGRPTFILYNVVIWEIAKKCLALPQEAVLDVIQAATVLIGALGVLLMARLASRLLSPRAGRMALLGMLLSPLYAFYSGAVMTEVPMLVAVVAAAILGLPSPTQGLATRALLCGAFFGIAVGIREQALTLAAAFLWLIMITRGDRRARIRSLGSFVLGASVTALAPVLLAYISDPCTFVERVRGWTRTIPTAATHFTANLSATLLFVFLICPASWIAMALVTVARGPRTPTACQHEGVATARSRVLPVPVSPAFWIWGVVTSIVLPVAILWRDADVQMHPRYLLVALPGALILCAGLYHCRRPSPGSAAAWAMIHILIFAAAAVVMQPFRAAQHERKAYTSVVLEMIPGEGLLLAGSYSPVFDFYRTTGVRPRWRVLWSGWGWDRYAVATEISRALARRESVYLCDGPYAWLNLEDERLDLHHILRGQPGEVVAPGLRRFSGLSVTRRPAPRDSSVR